MMTPAREALIVDRYLGYLDKWRTLVDADGRVASTYRELAKLTGVRSRSVGPALRQMESRRMIEELSSHSVRGTTFKVISRAKLLEESAR